MGIPSIFQTGNSGLIAAKAAIATTGHNITNSNTEGYSRQRVQTRASDPRGGQFGHNTIGTGTQVTRVERINDEYVEKQIRMAQKDLSYFEEKDMSLTQVEDIFNEMNGDGINRLISRFFNEIRKLTNEPESPAVRQSVREATQTMVNDFRRVRKEVEEVRRHIDARIEGYCNEINSLTAEFKNLDDRIIRLELAGGPANDLRDQRDVLMKKLGSFMNLSFHKDKNGSMNADIMGVGPLISGAEPERLTVGRSPADDQGKPEGALDIRSSGNVRGIITHQIKGGKLGALLEVRDQSISTVLDRLDDLAFTMSQSVNEMHRAGYTLGGATQVNFFKPLATKERAAEFMSLSDEVKSNISNIAMALEPNAPGDNRIGIAITQLQNEPLLNHGHATMDEWYNSIVSDVGVISAKNKFSMNQQKDIMLQLGKVRDQISGVSIDEETANLMQFQQVYDASAKVIQVADDLLKTVLSLKRD